MTRLQKFVEKGAYGEGPGRTAYVLDSHSLPQAADGMNWQEVVSFSAADEVFSDPGLKAVAKAAIDKGGEIVAQTGSLIANPVAHAPRLRKTVPGIEGRARMRVAAGDACRDRGSDFPSPWRNYPPRGPYPQQEDCPQGRQLRQQRYFPPQMTDCQVLDADTAEQRRLRR